LYRVAEGSGFNEKSMKLFQLNMMSIPGLFLHVTNLSPQVLCVYTLEGYSKKNLGSHLIELSKLCIKRLDRSFISISERCSLNGLGYVLNKSSSLNPSLDILI
jgi:hypothetical protein